ncbi:Tfp pilus assembly protein FimT/FimU [Aerosakkonemataceae cyanobacterium BLCC-F154]|uniref:Tfp pilus assembly protein FimT/FimU n=1 Tax=Floridaenema fluviatile BLCC-F154 TaxID=3153640 RepID=A0ABV4YEM4_9CYAN
MLKLKKNRRKISLGLNQPNAGFTLIEMVVIIVLIGVLATIGANSWLGFLSRQRLSSAQTEAVTIIRDAQAKAKQKAIVYTACFRDDGKKVQWQVARVNANECGKIQGWNNLSGSDANTIAIDPANSKSSDSSSGIYYTFSFREKGWVQPKPNPSVNPDTIDNSVDQGKITFITRNQPQASKRCVALATLLGSLRTASNDECK